MPRLRHARAALAATSLLVAAFVSPGIARAETHDEPDRAPGQAGIVSGALMFAIPYAASDVVGIAYSLERNVFCSLDGEVELRAIAGASTPSCPNRGYGWLTVPVAGPFITLGGYPQEALPAVLIAADGALQLAGVALLTVAIVRNERARDRSRVQKAALDIVPSSPVALLGLTLRVTAM